MAKVINQSIPSEYEKLYGEIARPAFEMFPGSGNYYSQRRFPFRLPARAGKGNIDGTPNQHEVRQIFKECANCYNIQPYSGGVTPPAVGPRDRSWWYTQAAGSGLWYYDYFMQQTLNSRFADTVPDWCKLESPVTDDTQVRSAWRNTNYGLYGLLYVMYAALGGGVIQLYIKQPQSDLNYLSLYCYSKSSADKELRIYNAGASWGEHTLTWNNKPALGSFIRTVEDEDVAASSWVKINLGTDLTNGIVLVTPHTGSPSHRWFRFCSSDYSNPNYHPFWTNY